MSTETAKAGDFLYKHPRAFFHLFVFFIFFAWQSAVAVLGFILYVLFARICKISVWYLLAAGVFSALWVFAIQPYPFFSWQSLEYFLAQGFWLNVELWEKVFKNDSFSSIDYFLLNDTHDYWVGFSLLFVSCLQLVDLIPDPAHRQALRALRRGDSPDSFLGDEKSHQHLQSALKRVGNEVTDGVVLGVSKTTGKPAVLPDAHINQLVLVLGTTGSGKTVTLRRFYQRAMQQHYPLIIVDGKPTGENTAWIAETAAKQGKRFYGFNCGNFSHYDPLAQGGYTELKDKIISLKDEWASDYYRSIAEDYLQTTFEVLMASGEPYDLKRVVEFLDYEELTTLVRKNNDERLMARVKRLSNYKRDDITGLQAHLSLLIHSELGKYFEKVDGNTFNLQDVIAQNAVVYFALPALRFPSFSTVLGKLIINDIKAVIDRETSQKRIFTIFDEFSVFAGEQVLNLVNMGRGKGVHAVFGTQGIADLKKIHPAFADQVLNCVNTILCHRVNDQSSAEVVASWAGTRETFDLTAQVDMRNGSTGLGSVRRNKEFMVHPDAIKQSLHPGEAFLISKVGKFRLEKIKVKYT